MNYMVLDFETRSTADINRGITHYLTGCEAICMGVKPFNGKSQVVFFKDIAPLAEKLKVFAQRNFIVCHNAVFDFAVFQKITKCEDSLLLRFIDTACLSSFSGFPTFESGYVSLYQASRFFGVRQKAYGKHLIDTLSIPYSKKTPALCEGIETKRYVQPNGYVEHPKLYEKMGKYCLDDVESTYDLFGKISKNVDLFHKLGLHRNYYLNFLRNRKGVAFDTHLAGVLKKQLERLGHIYSFYAKMVTGDDEFNVNSSQQVKKFLNKHNVYPKTTQSKDLLRVGSPDPKVKKLIKLRLTRPTGIAKKLDTILSRCNRSNIVKDSMFFHGAFSGRYTSSGTLNLLNFPRNEGDLEEVYEDIRTDVFFKKNMFNSFKLLKGQMRKCVWAHEECLFYGGDFSAIEFRLLMACSKSVNTLKKINAGWDAYVSMASFIYDKPEKGVTKQERYVAKRAVLAFGYGLGTNALIDMLAQDDIHIGHALALKAYTRYFDMFPRVKMFWEECFRPFKGVKKKELVEVKVPFSGKKLFFHGVQEKEDRNYPNGSVSCYRSPMGLVPIYPSKVCALAVQSLAAGLFHFAERNLYEELGLISDIPIHDEFLCSVKKEDIKAGKISLNVFKDCISRVPEWLPKSGFPEIKTEVWEGKRYLK